MIKFLIPKIDKPTEEGLSKYLTRSMEAFSSLTGLPVTYYDRENRICAEFGGKNKICKIFKNYGDLSSPCRLNLSSSGEFASRLGEPYIYQCPSGLLNITMALIADQQFLGYFTVGPMMIRRRSEKVIENFSELNDLDGATLSLAQLLVKDMQRYDAEQVSMISIMLYNTVITAVSDRSTYDAIRDRFGRQDLISAHIPDFQNVLPVNYPLELEQDLMNSMLNGDTGEAVRQIRQIMKSFAVYDHDRLGAVKARCLWLFSIMTHVAGQRTTGISQTINAGIEMIDQINSASDLTDLADTAEALVFALTDGIKNIYTGHSQIVASALRYINENYARKITLSMIEEELHVNGSYFSTLFKNEMGVSFTQYLNRRRIEEACRLLTTTDQNIVDILLAVGFEDQSYFTKVFKKETGMTPRQYRNQNM